MLSSRGVGSQNRGLSPVTGHRVRLVVRFLTLSNRTHLDAQFSILAAHQNDPRSSRNNNAEAHPPLQTSGLRTSGGFPDTMCHPSQVVSTPGTPWPGRSLHTRESPHTIHAVVDQHGAVDGGECHLASGLSGEGNGVTTPPVPSAHRRYKSALKDQLCLLPTQICYLVSPDGLSSSCLES